MMLNRITKHLDFGSAEFLLAFIPFLTPYGIGIIHMDMLSCFIVAAICYFRRQEKWTPKFYRLFVAFIIIHELVLCVTMPVMKVSHLNNLINMMVFLFTIMIVGPAIDLEKFKRSTYLLGIIASIGIIYQFKQVLSGNIISPLNLPFMDIFFERERGDQMVIRPMSFFDEPASYALYMILPMFFLLIEKKYLWYGLAVICVLLSTSTTGVVSCFSILLLYLIPHAKNKGLVIAVAIIIGLAGYALSNMEEFAATKDKIENTDSSSNSRMSNGPYLATHITPMELVLGINASNIQDYVKSHKELYKGIITFGVTDGFFVSSLWLILLKFGIIGFVLYYFIYYKLIRYDINLLPLLGTEAAVSYFGTVGISFYFSIVVITSIAFIMHERGYERIKW